MFTLRSVRRSKVLRKRDTRVRRLLVEPLEPRALLAGLTVVAGDLLQNMISADGATDKRSVNLSAGSSSNFSVHSPIEEGTGTGGRGEISGFLMVPGRPPLDIWLADNIRAATNKDNQLTGINASAGTEADHPVRLQIVPEAGEKIGDAVDVALHYTYYYAGDGATEGSVNLTVGDLFLVTGSPTQHSTGGTISLHARIGDELPVTMQLRGYPGMILLTLKDLWRLPSRYPCGCSGERPPSGPLPSA